MNTEPTTDRTTDAPPARASLLGGCTLLAALLVAVLGLATWLWTELGAPAGDGARQPATDTRPIDDRPTRSRRLALERELEQVERELAFARGQARSSSDPATRASWTAQVAELEAQRDQLRSRLGR